MCSPFIDKAAIAIVQMDTPIEAAIQLLRHPSGTYEPGYLAAIKQQMQSGLSITLHRSCKRKNTSTTDPYQSRFRAMDRRACSNGGAKWGWV
jgi:hypothetical protein